MTKKLRPKKSLNERALDMKFIEKAGGIVKMLLKDEMVPNPSNRKERRMVLKWNLNPTARKKFINGKKDLKIG